MKDEDLRLWAAVTATIRPLPGRHPPTVAEPASSPKGMAADGKRAAPAPAVRARRPAALQVIEPNRHRRLHLGRDALGARIDLHGLSQDAARRAVTEVIETAFARGVRAVLVITGKGTLGEGVLRRRVPEWLGEAPLRDLVAGLAEAHRRHGGAGALYVALRRRPPV
jgi:DNA-nicking Smr family endonuclease